MGSRGAVGVLGGASAGARLRHVRLLVPGTRLGVRHLLLVEGESGALVHALLARLSLFLTCAASYAARCTADPPGLCEQQQGRRGQTTPASAPALPATPTASATTPITP